MLRSTNTTLRAAKPAWRPSLNALRQQSTAAIAAVAEPVQAPEAPTPLSARAGGAGRGNLLTSAASDPFTEFLKNAQRLNNNGDRRRPTNNNSNSNSNNNNNRRDFKKTAAPGQFDDAVEKPRQQYKQRPQQQQQQQQQRSARPNSNSNSNRTDSSTNNNNNRTNRGRPANRPPRQRDGAPRTSAPAIMNAPTRRVTTFIDKDIDWNTISGLNAEEGVNQMDATGATVTDADKAAIASGEYQPYLDVTKQVQWAQPINVDALSSLVGGNASYGLDQKTAFLSALATATGSSVATTPSQ